MENNIIEKHEEDTSPKVVNMFEKVRGKIISLRNSQVILDSDIAELYGVETKRVNEAVKNNKDKFPDDYMFQLTNEEMIYLRSNFSTANISPKSRVLPKAFTEKGLYMLATILKSRQATNVTFAIIETFATVRQLKRELVSLHKESSVKDQQSRMKHFGEMLSNIVMPDLETSETESSLEINFLIGKIKHTVKRIKRQNDSDLTEMK
ncbi:ORF6N domain-containing protein [Bacteroides caecigallinarum]|uniref:ORF6N domain-containing protein n=1 Tax=Bacteroides caecigallinarum TaxID=1411144 RepID=UPI00195AB9B6|nr:ORF6N domain-containing protein [Bacteroides caecigallinarum]MBM6864469.1 ORF6N domain-containing protein [Bacteroides caecigallinarum]